MSGGGIPIPLSIDGARAVEILERFAQSMDKAGDATQKSGEKAQTSTLSWTELNSAVTLLTNTAGQIVRFADAIADLSAEQDALDRNTQRLHLDFDAGAAAFGRFADETDAMGVATAFASRNIRLTQDELNAVGRVSGSVSRDLRQGVGETSQQLTDALMNGSARALRPFGRDLEALAGPAHTVGERLAALQRHAEQVTPATDDARDAMARYRDTLGDAERVAASAFTTELTRLASLHTSFNQAHLDAEELNRDMAAVGAAAARIAAVVGAAITAIFSTIALGIRGTVDTARFAFETLSRVAHGSSFTDAARGARAQFLGENSAVGLINRAREASYDTLGGLVSDTGRDNANDAAVRGQVRGNTANTAAGAGPDSMVFSVADAEAIERNDTARRARGEGGGGGGGARHMSRAQLARIADKAAANAEFARQEELERQAKARQLASEAQLRADAQAMGQLEETSNTGDEAAARAARGSVAANRDRVAAGQKEQDEQRARQRDQGRQIKDYFRDQANAVVGYADTFKKAYEGMTEAAAAHFEAFVKGSETAGQAALGFVRDTLGALAKIAAQQAIFELGKGFAALFINPAEAGAHFAAAGLFAVVAAASGAGYAAVGPATPSAGAGASSAAGASARSAAGVSGRELGRGDAPGGVTNVYFNGGIYGVGGARQASRQLMGVLNDGARQGGSRLAPEALPLLQGGA